MQYRNCNSQYNLAHEIQMNHQNVCVCVYFGKTTIFDVVYIHSILRSVSMIFRFFKYISRLMILWLMRTCVLGSNTNNNILQHSFTLFSSSNIDVSVIAMWIANMNEPWSSIHKLLTKYTNQIGCGVFKIKEISALMHNKVAHQCCTLAL